MPRQKKKSAAQIKLEKQRAESRPPLDIAGLLGPRELASRPAGVAADANEVRAQHSETVQSILQAKASSSLDSGGDVKSDTPQITKGDAVSGGDVKSDAPQITKGDVVSTGDVKSDAPQTAEGDMGGVGDAKKEAPQSPQGDTVSGGHRKSGTPIASEGGGRKVSKKRNNPKSQKSRPVNPRTSKTPQSGQDNTSIGESDPEIFRTLVANGNKSILLQDPQKLMWDLEESLSQDLNLRAIKLYRTFFKLTFLKQQTHCLASLPELMEAANYKITSLKTALSALEDKGYLSTRGWLNEKIKGTIYELHLPVEFQDRVKIK